MKTVWTCQSGDYYIITDLKFTFTTFYFTLALVLKHDELATGIKEMIDIIHFVSLMPAYIIYDYLWLYLGQEIELCLCYLQSCKMVKLSHL